MAYPILVTGAAGRGGGIGRTVVELLLKQDLPVRAMVCSEDERAQSLRDMGAEGVAGDLLDLADMHRAIAGCERMCFGMSVSDTYLAATVNGGHIGRSALTCGGPGGRQFLFRLHVHENFRYLR